MRIDEQPIAMDITCYTPSARRSTREQIHSHIEEYLARGGRVEVVGPREIDYESIRARIRKEYMGAFGAEYWASKTP